ncbi:hypothetical protein KPL74_10370 [Bacillus sp. NP157]|nr:hypothetical protein KPL74_10370 [Bacillus sp. NP157]
MRMATLAVLAGLTTAMGAAAAQDASRSQDTPIETKTQTANTGRQTVHETPRSVEHGKQQHWSDAMNTQGQKDPRRKDEYGTPVPEAPKGQGTNSSTDAQRAADVKHP